VRLPATACHLIEAAWQVTLDEGFAQLTLAKISEASHENVSAVRYYFGNKAGLVRELLDAVSHEMVAGLATKLGRVPCAEPAVCLAEEMRIMNEPSDAARIFFAVLGEAVRDDALLDRLRHVSDVFFLLHIDQLRHILDLDDVDDADLAGMASLLSAIGNGLQVMALVASDSFDMDETIAALSGLFDSGLSSLTRPRSHGPASEIPGDGVSGCSPGVHQAGTCPDSEGQSLGEPS
jgi:AcrR family transcriptional regulator